MRTDKLNQALDKLLESHKRYVNRAVELYERNVEVQMATFTRATEAAEVELVKQLEALSKQADK